tara:strand:+ start:206 stop:1072 length:867 start_codon:yes stop_codon:yes gene_type:complete
MPPKCKTETKAELVVQTKQLKTSIDTVVSEFTCAITHDLPVDPVTAEDGQIYERDALKKWIDGGNRGYNPIRSPKFNTPMGSKMFPATQVRNVIEQMVRSGSISGSKVEAWSKKLEDEDQVKTVRAEAEGGDMGAMCALGLWYLHGEKGLSKNFEQAVSWFQRGDDLGAVTCTALLGSCYENGNGVRKDVAYALCLYSIAAKGGSELGCYCLADALAHGRHGLRTNARAATRWYRAMESARVRFENDNNRDNAAKWLREHAGDDACTSNASGSPAWRREYEEDLVDEW